MDFLNTFQNKPENIFSTILDTLPTAVLFLQNRKIIYANDAIKHIFGFEVDEMIGKETRILYRSDAEYETTGKQIYGALETIKLHKGIYPFKSKDGKDIICEIKAVKMSSSPPPEDNQVIVVFEDITERINAEKELSENDEQYRNFLENTHDIIASISPEGKFIHVNSTWYTAFGYTDSELPTLTVADIIQAADLQRLQAQFARAFNNESVINLNISCRTKSGAVIILEGNLIPRSFGSKVVAVWGFFRDITEQQKAQEEIQNKIKELERFNKIVINRELKMVELKNKIKKLQEQITQFAESK